MLHLTSGTKGGLGINGTLDSKVCDQASVLELLACHR